MEERLVTMQIKYSFKLMVDYELVARGLSVTRLQAIT